MKPNSQKLLQQQTVLFSIAALLVWSTQYAMANDADANLQATAPQAVSPISNESSTSDSSVSASTSQGVASSEVAALDALESLLDTDKPVSLIDEPSSDEDEEGLLKLPETFVVNGKPLTLRIVPIGENEAASVWIDNKEVFRLRTPQGDEDYSIENQARAAMSRLVNYLQSGGDPKAIEAVSLEDGTAVVRARNIVLLSITEEMAALAKHDCSLSLAKSWALQLRKGLGVQEPFTMSNFINKANPLSGALYESTGRILQGRASWYGPGFHGRRSADGSRFDMNKLTAAHRTLPFGTIVRVKYPRTGKSCLAKITDRGPYGHGRIIDLSKGAAEAIGLKGAGVGTVTVEVMSPKGPSKISSSKISKLSME